VVEPYVIAADVYTAEGHLGRGGWTWYTGSAGWLYRLGIEQLLGLRRTCDTLTLQPCLPPDWSSSMLLYRVGATTYRILMTQGEGPDRMTVDGRPVIGDSFVLVDDGGDHTVERHQQQPGPADRS
jgi:cellobiose phosphorylase